MKILDKISENKLNRKIWIIFITLLILVMSNNSQANEFKYQTNRVLAE